MKIKNKIFSYLILIVIAFSACRDKIALPQTYKTKNVLIVVVDGPRYSETFGDSTHQNIPRLSQELLPKGVLYTQFHNEGPTYTISGHAAMMTGKYQSINNSGLELPKDPSLFQHWLQTHQKDSTVAWLISSKDKLEVLSNCQDSIWKNQYRPSRDCGLDGLGSGYRTDSTTFAQTLDILTTHHPQLVLLNFREPDYSAHRNNWPDYIQGILDTDEYVYQLWNFIENDAYYKDQTALFVTNDHGRHLDSIGVGFSSHGDNCEGCRHISLFAYGPDFKENCILDTPRELIDIAPTIGELMQIETPNSEGQILDELFK